MGGIKIPNFYASPLHNNGITVGENTGEVQEDEKGKFVLRSEESVAGKQGDTLRIKNPKLIEGGYLKGGDYKTKKISDQNYDLSPRMETKFGGTPDNTEEQEAYEKATEELYAEGKITETDDKAVRLIKRRVKKNAKKLSK